MNREDQTEAPNEEIAGAPTLDSDEASRALARVQQVLDSDEDRARALEKAREKAEKAARAKSGGSEKPDEDDKDDEASTAETASTAGSKTSSSESSDERASSRLIVPSFTVPRI